MKYLKGGGLAAEESIQAPTPQVQDALINLLAGSLAFSVALIATMLGILLDLSSGTFERVRIASELFAVLGTGAFAMWFTAVKRGRI